MPYEHGQLTIIIQYNFILMCKFLINCLTFRSPI